MDKLFWQVNVLHTISTKPRLVEYRTEFWPWSILVLQWAVPSQQLVVMRRKIRYEGVQENFVNALGRPRPIILHDLLNDV